MLKENVIAREALILEASNANLGEDLSSARLALAKLQKRWMELKPAPRNDFERLENAWKKSSRVIICSIER